MLEILYDNILFGVKMETPKVSRMWRDLQKATSRLVLLNVCFLITAKLIDRFSSYVCDRDLSKNRSPVFC